MKIVRVDTDVDDITYGAVEPEGIRIYRGTPFVAWGPARASAEQREDWLEEYGQRLLTIAETEPLRLPSPEDFDSQTFGRRK